MRRIIYQSRAARDLDRGEVFRLVYHARMANMRKALNGFLLFADQRFFQVLEGEPWTLMSTYAAIRDDPRHFDVELLDQRSIDAPLFSRWRMRSFHDESPEDAIAAIRLEAQGALPDVLAQAVEAFFDRRAVLPAAAGAARPA